MKEPIISVSTLAFLGFDLLTAVRTLASLKIEYIEFAFIMGYSESLSEDCFSKEHSQTLKKMLADYGLHTKALAAHMDLGLKNSQDEFKYRMDFAKEIGASIIITNSSTEKNRESFFRNMEHLAAYAGSIGITIAFENPGDGEDNLIGCGKDGAKIVEKIGSPFVRLNYDVCNTFSYSKGTLRPEEDFKHALPYAVHYHLKDMRADNKGWYFSEIGNDLINYDQILKFLFQQPEQVPIGLEMPIKLRRDKNFIPQKKPETVNLEHISRTIKASLEYINKILMNIDDG